MSQEQLIKTLEKKLRESGVPLEMKFVRQAKALENSTEFDLACLVSGNASYVDVNSGDRRETDAIIEMTATINDEKVVIVMVIELKNTSEPWVILSHRARPFPYPAVPSGLSLGAIRGEVGPRSFLSLMKTVRERAASRHLYRGYSMKNPTKSRDTAYDALMQIMSAAVAISEQQQRPAPRDPAYVIVCPILITAGPLFAGTLDEAGEIRVTPIREGFCTATMSVPDGVRVANVRVLSTDMIETFLEDIRTIAEVIKEIRDVEDDTEPPF